MADSTGLVQLILLALAAFSTMNALFLGVTYSHLQSHLALVPASPRARLLRWICAAPLLGGAMLTAACLLPSVVGAFWPQFDHCLNHHGHAHICVIHRPASGGLLGWLLNGMFWGLLLFVAGRVAWRAVKAGRILRRFRQSARYDPRLGVHVIPSTAPFSLVVGLLRHRVLVSTALAHAIPPPLLRIVLAHEEGHVRRRDSLWQLIATLVSVAHLPATRRQLLADLMLAAEQACDQEAADLVGDRIGVARAILFVERLLTERIPSMALAPGFGGSNVAARVEALLASPLPGRNASWRFGVTALLFGAAVIATSDHLHHWTETLLSFLSN